jgi:predicted DNA-binding transcriptional regulator AlpA
LAEISTVESNGKIQIQFALTEPKDDDLIGFPEIARMLNSDIATVRRLNGARARAKQRFPFPQPIKLGGEITRWRCYVIKDWIKQYENANEKLPVRK